MSEWVIANKEVILINIILLLVCAVGSWILVKAMMRNRAIHKATTKIIQTAKRNSDKRILQEQELRLQEGNQEDIKFFYKIDLALAQSGLSEKIPFLTTEIFLTIIAFFTALSCFIVLKFTNVLLYGIFAGIAVISLFYVFIFLLTSKNYQKVEENIIQFANLMENYSQTTDDIISIMGKVVVYLEEPLSGAVLECYNEAKSTGDVSASLNRLELKVEHPKFKELIQNLEICSRYEANYGVIINDSRDIIRKYIEQREKKINRVKAARINILILFATQVLTIWMMNSINEEPVFAVLTGSFSGKCILLFLFTIYLYAIWKMISLGKKE